MSIGYFIDNGSVSLLSCVPRAHTSEAIQRSAPDEKLLAAVAHRMEAIPIGHLALLHHISWSEPASIDIYFNGQQVVGGNTMGVTNAAMQAATVHCRALLEFLGWQATGPSIAEISNRPKRLPDDGCAQQFAGLSMVTREKALAANAGPAAEAGAALSLIFRPASKGLAHLTNSFIRCGGEVVLLEVACRGVPILLIDRFYTPIGIEPSTYELTARSPIT